jgi:hypothetical protein
MLINTKDNRKMVETLKYFLAKGTMSSAPFELDPI